MNRTLILSLALVVGLVWSSSVKAQTNGAIRGWDPLPDSLFLIWALEEDQVRRLRVIEEDHEADRMAITTNKGLSDQQRQQQLEELAAQRRQEIKAVLQLKQFEDWERRSRTASPR